MDSLLNVTVDNPRTFVFPKAPHLKIVAENWPPHIYLRKLSNGTIICEGPMGKLLNTLATSLNFTYEVFYGDGFWGAPQDNELLNWNGMIGFVHRNEAIVGLGPFGMSDVRNKVVDFTVPIFLEKNCIMVKRPMPQSDPWSFSAPFYWTVWLCIFGASFGFLIIHFIHSRMKKDNNVTASNFIFEQLRIITGQSLNKPPKNTKMRALIGFWTLIVIVLAKSYSGILTSLMAVKKVSVKHDSISDIMTDKSLNILMEDSTTLTAFMEKAESGLYKELYSSIKDRTTLMTVTDVYEAAFKYLPLGSYAVLIETTVCHKIYSDQFSKSGYCNFYITKGTFWPQSYGIVIQKGSILRSLFDERITSLTESGLLSKWTMAEMPNMTACIQMPTTIATKRAMQFEDIWVFYSLMAFGLLLSTVVCFTEVFVAKIFKT